MKLFKFYLLEINPIYRDLVIILVAGFLVSSAIVTVGYMIASQF
ncbi:hypothetical protein BH09BAC3_BH09BAC3_16270 [soil metagenome]